MYRAIVAADQRNPFPPPPRSRLRLIARGYLPEDCQLYDLGRWPLEHYVSAMAREVALARIQQRYNVCLHNKYLFQVMMQSTTQRVAKAFGLITRGTSLDFASDEPIADAKAWLRDLVAAHGKVVVKPVAGHAGEGVRILATAADAESVTIGEAGVMVMHFVEQHAYARAIFPDATNTLRVLVMRDDDGPFLATAVQRVGTSASAPIDSFRSGGMSVGIDAASGQLLRGVRQPKRSGGALVWLERHPDTDAAITGVELPGWHALVAELLAIMERLPFLSYVGWDVVITDDGFTIIEGNHNSGVALLQIHGPLLVDERVKAFYRRYGLRA